jgi:protein-S-isoprenylcysteine O-methyltransferase
MELHAAYILAAGWGISELCLMRKRRSGSNSVSRDRNSLRLIWLAAIGSIALSMFVVPKVSAWNLPWSGQLYVAGICCFAGGLVLRWYSIIYLGRFFTVNVAIASDHKLIDSGPYRWARHPSYTGAILVFLGIGLCTGNVALLVVIVVPYLAAILWRIHVEEEALLAAFGQQYRDYMRKTRRLIPLVY